VRLPVRLLLATMLVIMGLMTYHVAARAETLLPPISDLSRSEAIFHREAER